MNNIKAYSKVYNLSILNENTMEVVNNEIVNEVKLSYINGDLYLFFTNQCLNEELHDFYIKYLNHLKNGMQDNLKIMIEVEGVNISGQRESKKIVLNTILECPTYKDLATIDIESVATFNMYFKIIQDIDIEF